jgi:phage baseplate assembly protein W
MTIYKGFSTQNVNSTRSINIPTGLVDYTTNVGSSGVSSTKYSIVDDETVILDFLNALNIPQGSKPGKPSYGTNLWNFIFEPNDYETSTQLKEELIRVARLDPRIILNNVTIYAKDNGIVASIELAVSPANQVRDIAILFNQETNTASLS